MEKPWKSDILVHHFKDSQYHLLQPVLQWPPLPLYFAGVAWQSLISGGTTGHLVSCFSFLWPLLQPTQNLSTHNLNVLTVNTCCCCCYVTSIMPDSVRPHRPQPIRLRSPWDSPGKDTGMGCHFLLQGMIVKSESEVFQSCPTLHDPMDCSLPGSSVHGIF